MSFCDASRPFVIFGAGGMLGHDLSEALHAAGCPFIPLTHAECDLTDAEAVTEIVDRHTPSAVINCAAWTDVDGAETNRAAAYALNADAVAELGRIARTRRIYCMTLSTDYVFAGEGSEPHLELPADAAHAEAFAPHSAYGASKLEGERRLNEIFAGGGLHCIVRAQALYGAYGRNFVDTIRLLAGSRERIQVVADQISAPTWTRDLAQGLMRLLQLRATGTFHVANTGYASFHEVACAIAARVNPHCVVEPVTSEHFARPARRPENSRLDQSRFVAATGAPLRPWPVALAEYLDLPVC